MCCCKGCGNWLLNSKSTLQIPRAISIDLVWAQVTEEPGFCFVYRPENPLEVLGEFLLQKSKELENTGAAAAAVMGGGAPAA